MNQPIMKTKYREILPDLAKALGIGNALALPRVMKVTVNVGIGKFQKEQARVDEILEALTAITGQKPVLAKARKAIAGFKIREGLEVGARVTLRGRRMWQFLDRFLLTTLPRTRDFQGIPLSSVDASGNCNIGLREHMIFPEVVPEKVQTVFGLQITVTTTAKDRESGLELFRKLGFPFRTEEA
ncbi:MAG TPA: 50S ribosomal protein L5 [Candidatus Fimivivens sp.]|nr:50S ribosomal protein L5 [Candidatus Fimivivens sp.]